MITDLITVRVHKLSEEFMKHGATREQKQWFRLLLPFWRRRDVKREHQRIQKTVPNRNTRALLMVATTPSSHIVELYLLALLLAS